MFSQCKGFAIFSPNKRLAIQASRLVFNHLVLSEVEHPRGDSNARTQQRGSPPYALDPGVRLIHSTTETLPEIEQVISLVVFSRPDHGLLYLILMQ